MTSYVEFSCYWMGMKKSSMPSHNAFKWHDNTNFLTEDPFFSWDQSSLNLDKPCVCVSYTPPGRILARNLDCNEPSRVICRISE